MREVKLTDKEINCILDSLQYMNLYTDDNKLIRKSLFQRLKKVLKPPTKIQSRKSNARNLQKWVCQKIADILNIEYNQQNDQCPIHSREMGQPGNDIVFRNEEIIKKFPYSIECKSGKTLNLKGTIRQVKNNMIKGTEWIIVHKSNSFHNPIVIMEWDCFKKLFRKEK